MSYPVHLQQQDGCGEVRSRSAPSVRYFPIWCATNLPQTPTGVLRTGSRANLSLNMSWVPYMAVLTWWLDGGTKLPPDQIDAMFRRLVTEGATPKGS
ncbi:hypothetical protein [Pararhizobium sp. LjRoot238]|uniref:hypothetical protein n=1 Tax=Pararhizobium sp. LjRoot238 TaxID=3342293 RepID=UPI003ECD56CC